METYNPVAPASTAARPGSDRTHSTTIRRHPGIRNAFPVVFATTEGYPIIENGRTRRARADLWGPLAELPRRSWSPAVPTLLPRILGGTPRDVAKHSGVGRRGLYE
jgi:hypothetical protein